MNTSENKNLELLGDEVSRLLPETISREFRSSVSKVAASRAEINRAFAVILLGCAWVIALRGRRESEVAKAAMESTFATVHKRLKTLIDGHRLMPISMQWTVAATAIIVPLLLIVSSWFMVFKTHFAALEKPVGDSSGFSIFHQPGKAPIYGVYSPGGPPRFEPAQETGWYVVTPEITPPR